MAYKIIRESNLRGGYRQAAGTNVLARVSRPDGLQITQELLDRCTPQFVESTLLAHHTDTGEGFAVYDPFDSSSIIVEAVVRCNDDSRRLIEEYLERLGAVLSALDYDFLDINKAFEDVKNWGLANSPRGL